MFWSSTSIDKTLFLISKSLIYDSAFFIHPSATFFIRQFNGQFIIDIQEIFLCYTSKKILIKCCADHRSRDNDRSPDRHRAARIRIALKILIVDPDEDLKIVPYAAAVIG